MPTSTPAQPDPVEFPPVDLEATALVADVLRYATGYGEGEGHAATQATLQDLAADLDNARRAVTTVASDRPIPDEEPLPGASSGWGYVQDFGGGQFRVLVDRDTMEYPTGRVWWCEAGALPDDAPRRTVGVAFPDEERERIMVLAAAGTPDSLAEAQRLILARLDGTPTHGATDPARELTAAYDDQATRPSSFPRAGDQAVVRVALTFSAVEAEQVRRLLEDDEPAAAWSVLCHHLGPVEWAPAPSAAVQDEQAPGLAAAVSRLEAAVVAESGVMGQTSGMDDDPWVKAASEVVAAACGVSMVFHRQPVEGWAWAASWSTTPRYPEPRVFALAAVLERVVIESQSDAYLVDAVPARLVVDPGLTVVVSAEEAEAIRHAGARLIPDVATGYRTAVEAEAQERTVPPVDLPGAGNVARPDSL